MTKTAREVALFILESTGDYLYHHTKPEHLGSIRKHGLQPRKEKHEWLKKPATETNHGLHFHDTESSGGSIGNVRLRVHRKHANGLTQRDSSGWRVDHSVAPEHVEIHHEGEWKPIR